jgi:DNA polymerase
LKEHGAHIYAMHPSTGVHFICFAVDNGEVQTWRPGDPVPEVFINPTGYRFVSHNWTFENAILKHVLIPRYGFVPIPWESQDCAMRLALANAYPAELGLCCEALGLPYRKDPEARKAMLRLSRPQTAKKKPVDPEQRDRDLALLLERGKSDVAATRAVHRSQLLRPHLPEERELLLLDAKINERGICANVQFLEAVRDLAVRERNAVNVRLNELTAGVVTSVDQVARIKEAINSRGHNMKSLGKLAVAATLADDPDAFVRELLHLRQQGAYASVRMAKRLLGYADPSDGRIRGALRIFAAGPGRWSSPGPQLHNLRRNDTGYPGTLVATVTAGGRAGLARYGNPLAVAAELSRAALRARPGHVLVCADFGAIESRVLAWFAGETWKLDAYRHYDATGDKSREPYRVIAGRMLNKDAGGIIKAERQQGKSAELACGFGGSIGAWRRIAGEDGRSDAEVLAIIHQWRAAHPAIREFWKALARAARVAIRTEQTIQVGGGPLPKIIAVFDGHALTLMIPSGRAVNYPGARLVANRKFEDGDPDIEFFDNAKGQWKRTRAWFGTLVENVVQATARDLLAAALLRFEARGLPVVFHCHDEVVIEAEEGAVTADDVLAILLEPPPWAAGLPLGGKVHAGPIYFEEPDQPIQPKDTTAPSPDPITAEPATALALFEQQIDEFVASAQPLPATKAMERSAEDTFLASLDESRAPLWELVSLPVDASRRVSCPFHPDENPSCFALRRSLLLPRLRGAGLAARMADASRVDEPQRSHRRHDGLERVIGRRAAHPRQGENQLRTVLVGDRHPAYRDARRTLSRRRARDRRRQAAGLDQRGAALSPALRVRRYLCALRPGADARRTDRYPTWRAAHRARSRPRGQGHQAGPPRARPQGRGEAVADRGRRPADDWRGRRDRARRGDADSVAGAADARLVDDRQRRLGKVPGHRGRGTPRRPGRPRRSWHGGSARPAAALGGRGAAGGCAAAQAAGMGL